MKKLLYILSMLFFFPFSLMAQEVEMADKFRTDGKIYVVVAVVLVVLIGILIYVFALDRKISKIEKEIIEKGK